jgi:hypothetical protein
VTGEGFDTFPNRIWGELDDRIKLAARSLKFNNTFLDDILRGMLPHDLVLLGAPTGMGKTDLSLAIATSNAMEGRRVAYFALEAEPRELERRTKYRLLNGLLYLEKNPNAGDFNYADWIRGECESYCGHLNEEVDNKIIDQLATLHTYYRGERFDQETLRAEVMKAAVWADFVIVDHLHYIDTDADENEARSQGEIVKTVRDLSLRIGRPILLVAHLRKRSGDDKKIIANVDDFHGSSNITKIATQAIVIERAHCVTPSKWFLSPTFMSVVKDRRAGTTGHVALVNFDLRSRNYRQEYTLGRRSGKGGAEWEPIKPSDKPRWAAHHKDLETPQ